VTPIAGTTRDALREAIQIEGVPITVVDTAGLREAADMIEELGIQRTQSELARADLVLLIAEAGDPSPPLRGIPGEVMRIDVYNKIDLVPHFSVPTGAVAVSARTGEGLEALRRAILAAAGWSSTGESVFLARERHLRALERARGHLAAAGAQLPRWEFFAEELRLAHSELGTIGGDFTADDLLGHIFSRFCIGK
jgi:tRNA modification GTPase